MDNYHVITGGPGAGKTTLIAALRARGHCCVDEVGRGIIQAQVAIGGNALHWGDRRIFAELMLSHAIADYERHRDHSGPVFFDRGIAELIGYCHLTCMPVPEHFRSAARLYRTASPVFVAPPWAEIYANDDERRQDFAEAEATCAAVTDACHGCGYETVELPKASVEARVDFILARIVG